MRRAYPVLLSLALAVPVLTGCGGQTAETTSAFPDATSIVLSDDGVTVDGEAAPTAETAAVYTAHDIVYYEAGRDFTYGEGTEADEHTAEEAAAHTVVHITQPGTYAVSGTLSAGQIAVDLGEDAEDDQSAVVTLILNGADITCTVAPAVIFYSVYECGSTDEDAAAATVDTSAAGANVLIADGTVNNVTGSYVARIYEPDSVVLSEDGTEVADSSKLHKYDGAFYSKMSMNVGGGEDGSGVLNITADNEGLDTELHLTINGGNINITSGNDGINTNEDNVSVTTINDGVLNIQVTGETGEGDGIDSNGYLVINGGAVTAAACAESGDAGIDATAAALVEGKMGATYLGLFVLGILCNICIFIAVNGYANNPHQVGKYLALFLGVSVFILCGTEHSVADMYYWSVSGVLYAQPGESVLRLLIISLGNVVGGVFFPLMEKGKRRLDLPEAS